MTVESVTYIDDLNASYPAGTDVKSEGDNHIRNIKTSLKNSFPGVTGPVTATQAELNILDGATVTTAELNILDGVTSTAAELNILDGATLTTAELNYVDGVTSAIQTQLDAKVDDSEFTGANQSIVEDGYQKLPGGVILQWGKATSSGTTQPNLSVTLPLEFPNAVLSMTFGIINGSGYVVGLVSVATDSFTASVRTIENVLTTGVNVYWFAVGH